MTGAVSPPPVPPSVEDRAEGDRLIPDYALEADQADAVSPELVDAVAATLEADADEAVRSLVAPLHVADIAELLQRLRPDLRGALVRSLGDQLDADVFGHLAEDVRDDVLDEIGPIATARVVSALDSDDAVYVLEDLEEEERRPILEAMSAPERVRLEEGLAYKEQSCGRLMQREFVAVRDFWTVGETIDWLRSSEDLPDDFYDIFIVDPDARPIGSVPLSRLLRSRRPVVVADIMQTDLQTVTVDTVQEDAARLFSHYGLIELPVLDARGRLVGVVTFDDVVEVIEEEAAGEVMRIAGVGQTDTGESVWRTTANRFAWLFVNLLTAVVASVVIGAFEDTIAQAVILAVLCPIVASMGGNAGTQTLTVAVRALATREVTAREGLRLVAKEGLVGLLNGVLFAVLCGGAVWAWTGLPMLGLVMALAMTANLVSAGLAGSAIPLLLQRARVDPAIGSGVFLTTVTDVVGFFAFLGLAAWLLL